MSTISDKISLSNIYSADNVRLMGILETKMPFLLFEIIVSIPTIMSPPSTINVDADAVTRGSGILEFQAIKASISFILTLILSKIPARNDG